MELITPLLPSSTLPEDKHSTLKLRSTSSSSVRIHELEMVNGEFLRLLNVSNSDDYDLSDHFLQQNLRSQILCRYRFPPNTVLRSGQTLTVTLLLVSLLSYLLCSRSIAELREMFILILRTFFFGKNNDNGNIPLNV